MNDEDIKKILDKLKITLQNYELDKKTGRLSVDSIYSLFPTEQIQIINCIENLQREKNILKAELHYYKNTLIKYVRHEELSTGQLKTIVNFMELDKKELMNNGFMD